MTKYEPVTFPADVKLLLNILGYRRKHDSESEFEFINDVLLPRLPNVEVFSDGDTPMVYVVRVGESKTIFSSHVDTCHRTSGRQVLAYDVESSLIYKSTNKEDRECLGADNGAGIFLMLEMIYSGIPGVYVFHRGEECGGIGSRWLAKQHPEFLRQFDRAIAFDRAGTTDVITHQAMGRCCSDEFAEALALKLNLTHELEFKPSPDGVFTDTANYVELIPECSNLSVGYAMQHGPDEYQDVEFLLKLRDSLLNVDWESLPTVRDPSKIESGFNWYSEGLAGEDLKFMTRKELKAWVRSSSAAEIASAIEDLLIELEGYESLAVQDTEHEFESEPYYEEAWR